MLYLQSFEDAAYHVRTLWLFTRSDLKTVFLPQMVLTTFNAFSGFFVDDSTAKTASLTTIIARLPVAAFWIWCHLLLEVIANQRLPRSIEEDSKNKPWRPLPSKRLLPETATAILRSAIPTALCMSFLLGETTLLASALFCVLTWLYNDLDGAGSGVFIRNVLNACGLVSFSVGATAIAVGEDRFPARGWIWFSLLWWIILTTVQTQDLADIEGDIAIGRKKMPLVLGDQTTRWSVAIPVTIWSVVCLVFWGLGTFGCIMLLLTGGLLAWNVVCRQTRQADVLSWRLWCLWIVFISSLPSHAARPIRIGSNLISVRGLDWMVSIEQVWDSRIASPAADSG